MNMEAVPLVILTHVFSFLETEDLLRAARVCYKWWEVITRGKYLKETELFELDLSGSGDLYCFVPRKMFAPLTWLNISATNISNRHFQQMISTACNLEHLDISECASLDQSCIFQAKNAFSQLEYINISGNREKFTILVVACLCSCENVRTIVVCGYDFTADELLFLSKTFETVASSDLELEIEDGYNPLPVLSEFEQELYEDLFF